ncbi:MAG: SH3 domain-containing protein [Pseudoxanthomonas sp.]
MKRYALLGALLAAAAFAPAALAQVHPGYTNRSANLRSGPDVGYPRILTLPPGAPVTIFGCVDDWSWCDVQYRGERGWLSAGLLDFDDHGRRVGVDRYGADIGLPILTFALGLYWSEHYRDRSWYRNRSRWEGYHPPARRPVQPQRPVAQRPVQQHPSAQSQRPAQQHPAAQGAAGNNKPAARPAAADKAPQKKKKDDKKPPEH